MQITRKSNRQGERGMALLLAIGFLALLSILGAVVMDNATRGIKGSGVMTPEKKAFYTADRAVEYSMNREVLVGLSLTEPPVNLVTDTTSGGVVHKTIIDSVNTVNGKLVSGSVADLGPKTLPSSIASFFGSEFGANVYHVAAEAEAGVTGNEKKVNVDASIVRLFKLDDDTIFRTNGGG